MGIGINGVFLYVGRTQITTSYMNKLFTKSAFKQALTCPTSLYYYNNPEYANQDLQDDRARLMKATTEDLRARLKKYAEANGYDLILDTNVVAYSKDSYDVTNELLKEMGVDPAKAKGKDKNEGK